jgi:hypothetical protein
MIKDRRRLPSCTVVGRTTLSRSCICTVPYKQINCPIDVAGGLGEVMGMDGGVKLKSQAATNT